MMKIELISITTDEIYEIKVTELSNKHNYDLTYVELLECLEFYSAKYNPEDIKLTTSNNVSFIRNKVVRALFV